jgi:hypothetical protein
MPNPVNTPAFIFVRPVIVRQVYLLECRFCGCEGMHTWYHNGSCKHGNGVTYGAGAIVARMIEMLDIDGVRSPTGSNVAQSPVGEGGKSQ